jgi:hypothetical protein
MDDKVEQLISMLERLEKAGTLQRILHDKGERRCLDTN